MCTVVNLYKDPYDIYIGRSKKGQPYNVWCNPFTLDNENERVQVIEQYKQHLWKQIKQGIVTKDMLISLDGKKLGCFCKPKACHGDIILKAVNWALGERL